MRYLGQSPFGPNNQWLRAPEEATHVVLLGVYPGAGTIDSDAAHTNPRLRQVNGLIKNNNGSINVDTILGEWDSFSWGAPWNGAPLRLLDGCVGVHVSDGPAAGMAAIVRGAVAWYAEGAR